MDNLSTPLFFVSVFNGISVFADTFIMTSKPYFTENVVNEISSIILSEILSDEKQTLEITDKLKNNISDYIKSPKSDEENLILQGVKNGVYLATIMKNNQTDKWEMAYKVKPPTSDEVNELLKLAQEKSDAANKQGEYVPSVYPEVKKEKYRAKISAQRTERENQKRASFEESKKTPTPSSIEDGILRSRAEKLSHLLNWLHSSPTKLFN